MSLETIGDLTLTALPLTGDEEIELEVTVSGTKVSRRATVNDISLSAVTLTDSFITVGVPGGRLPMGAN